MSAVFRTR